jgi:putative ATPase
MKDLGYGRGYNYAHDFPEGIVPQDYFPEELGTRTYYHPTDRGFEKIVGQRLEAWRKKLGRKS